MILTCRRSELGGPRWEGCSVRRGSAREGLEVRRRGALGQRGAVAPGTEHARPGGGGAGTELLPASRSGSRLERSLWGSSHGGRWRVGCGSMATCSLGLTMTPKSTA